MTLLTMLLILFIVGVIFAALGFVSGRIDKLERNINAREEGVTGDKNSS